MKVFPRGAKVRQRGCIKILSSANDDDQMRGLWRRLGVQNGILTGLRDLLIACDLSWATG